MRSTPYVGPGGCAGKIEGRPLPPLCPCQRQGGLVVVRISTCESWLADGCHWAFGRHGSYWAQQFSGGGRGPQDIDMGPDQTGPGRWCVTPDRVAVVQSDMPPLDK